MSQKSRAAREAKANANKLTITEKLNNTMSSNAKKACRYCYGRGYEGRMAGTNQLIPCRCIVKKAANDKEFYERLTKELEVANA